MDGKIEGAVAFAARCSAASALAYALALAVGLTQPLWASMASVIVSQERIGDTRATLASQVVGTAIGATISVVVGTLGVRLGGSPAIDTPIAVALAALVAHWFPKVRVAMWTCPIVLLTAHDDQSFVDVGARRAAEVLFGACVGWALHRVANAALSFTRKNGAN